MTVTSPPLRRAALAGLAALLYAGPAMAQFDTTGWRFAARTARIEPYLGRTALSLQGGLAWLPASRVLDGTVEFDVAFPDTVAFIGLVFRMRDRGNYEHWYLRPHLSRMADATQYTPVFNGVTGWQIYAGAPFTAPVRFRYDAWTHVKVEFAGDLAAVYVDADEPVQVVRLQRAPERGMVGLLASGVGTAHVANVVVRDGPAPAIRGAPPVPPPPGPGVVRAWSVSGVFPESALAGRGRLTEADLPPLTWSGAAPVERGIVNLAMLGGARGDTNTVLASVTLTADRARTVRVRFGFSDRVRVYLNGRLLYEADDAFATRDYRFLGTIGLFDALYLPLERGVNTLWFAVSETFGGWGITAALDQAPGVRVAAGCGRPACG